MGKERIEEWPLTALLRSARASVGGAIRESLEGSDMDDLPPNGPFVIGAIARSSAPLGAVASRWVTFPFAAVSPHCRLPFAAASPCCRGPFAAAARHSSHCRLFIRILLLIGNSMAIYRVIRYHVL